MRRRGRCSRGSSLGREIGTFFADVLVVGLPVVDDLDHQLLADEGIDGLHVQVHDPVVLQVPQPVYKVEQDAHLGPQRDGLDPRHDVEVQLVPLDELHHQRVRLVQSSLRPEVLGDEVRAAPFESGNDVLLVLQFVGELLLKLGLQLFDGYHSFLFVLVLVGTAVQRANEGDGCLRQVDETRTALVDWLRHAFLDVHLYGVEDVVVNALGALELGNRQQAPEPLFTGGVGVLKVVLDPAAGAEVSDVQEEPGEALHLTLGDDILPHASDLFPLLLQALLSLLKLGVLLGHPKSGGGGVEDLAEEQILAGPFLLGLSDDYVAAPVPVLPQEMIKLL